MTTRNIFTEAALEVGEELAARDKESREVEQKGVPFGDERLSRRQIRDRLGTDEGFRRDMLAKFGSAWVLDHWRKRR